MKIISLPYSIPSEYVIDESFSSIKDRKFSENVISVIQGYHRFGHLQEDEYLQGYRRSYFAETRKKGGWDCLRHYEIMAAGCIPFFENLENCPSRTLVTLPKDLLIRTKQEFENQEKIDIEKYQLYRSTLLCWFRLKCTSEAVFRNIFIPNVRPNFKKVLLVRGHEGVNYTREMTWIGLIRHLSNIDNSVIGELPRIPYLYTDFPLEETKRLYGNGFGYARKLDPSRKTVTSFEEIQDKTRSGYWDLIVYGKTGPDELEGGGEDRLLWQDVKGRYLKDQIVFLYGGDHPFNLMRPDHYRNHLTASAQHGVCFVRELE